jgi:hypothetical protein
MRSIHADTVEALSQSVVRLAFLALVEFPDPFKLAFTTLSRQVELGGETFIGAGNLGAVTQSSESGDLSPSQYQITVSGVNDDVLAAAGQLSYMNYRATVWAMTLDADEQIIGEPFIWFRGRTDQLTVSYGLTSSVVIDVRDRMTDWARAKIRRYTDEDHQSQFDGDKFFEFVSEVAGREVEWPADTWFRRNQ